MFMLVTISGCEYSIFNSGNAVMSVYVNQKVPPTYFSYNHSCSNLLSFFVQFRIDIQFINSKVLRWEMYIVENKSISSSK